MDDEINEDKQKYVQVIPALKVMIDIKFDQRPYNQNTDHFSIQPLNCLIILVPVYQADAFADA
ncbi:hypothetical protein IM792_02700 [Mucilaginibacter sp. JRF]|uniref:hypothetical protein n=1 Tax=Mucilaginibacter sp. JRF TaxID=2780088 RepID=UPI0018817752|nr:hypothetical protein [Mucilaginibacter sp. JRF]MBE9583346.1 hypothetical protein [Mucilaginibacter sp. JRF]